MENPVARTEDIVWRRIGDEIVVILENGQSVNVLNKTAAHIWELCDGTKGAEEIAASLCERFEVELEEATADVRDVISRFEKYGILMEASGVRS